MTIAEIIENVWKNGSITVASSDASAFEGSEMLDAEGIIAHHLENGDVIFNRENAVPVPVPVKHEYIMPDFTPNVRALIKYGCNIMLTGPMGTGKTEFVYEVTKDDFAKVYQVNGSENLTPDDFYGMMSVAVDEKTGQNYTRFEKGPLYRAFIEGTQLDAEGNQVLDAEGNPIVVGKPAVFFLDEFAAMLPEVLLGVFNRALEVPRNGGSRSIEIPRDNGRVVKSHPGLVVFLSGNTVGTGNVGNFQVAYTAQSNVMDESTLNRVIAGFKFGYCREAEYKLTLAEVKSDFEADCLFRLRDNLRDMYRSGQIQRLFSTRTMVSILTVACRYREGGVKQWLTDAIRDSVFNTLPDNDKHAWNEQIRALFNGRDLEAEEKNEKAKYDYF